jgi:hypothetical protein
LDYKDILFCIPRIPLNIIAGSGVKSRGSKSVVRMGGLSLLNGVEIEQASSAKVENKKPPDDFRGILFT